MSKPILYLMCGIPRSGKSTWAFENKNKGVIVCPDWFRTNIFGHQFEKTAEPFIWAITDTLIRSILDQKKNVILDACNLYPTTRGKYYNIAKEYDAEVICVYVNTPIDICLERNKKSKKNKKVPIDILKNMFAGLIEPNVDFESFDGIIRVIGE